MKLAMYGNMAKKSPRQDEFTQFAFDTLKIHNEYRAKHGVPELVLNKKLCNLSQEWANVCAKTATLEHRVDTPYGENLYFSFSSDPSDTPRAREVVKYWYDEIKGFTFGVEKVKDSTLHFTQLIWKSTKELGVGIAKNKNGESYVVTLYDPKGNYTGQFKENVPKPKRK